MSADVDPRMLGRFLEEAQITGQLDHPNIVPVYDLGLDSEGRPLIVLKKIEGTAWSDVMHRPGEIAARFGLDEAVIRARVQAGEWIGPRRRRHPERGALRDPRHRRAGGGLRGGHGAHAPGAGRQPFIGIAASGLDDGAGTMRSNASGIGTRLALRRHIQRGENGEN